MRTHAVPTEASANGKTNRVDHDERNAHPRRGAVRTQVFEALDPVLHASGPVRDPLAQQARGPEYQHGNQDHEREDVLIVAAEQHEVAVPRATRGESVGDSTTGGTSP